MPYTKTDFSAAVDSHLATINAESPLITPGRRWDPRSFPIANLQAFPNSTAINAVLSDQCWMNAYDARKAVWHTNILPCLGNGVAISKRHVIVSEHAGQAYTNERFLVWVGYNQAGVEDIDRYTEFADTHVQWIVGTLGTVARNGIYGTPNPSGIGNKSFRLCYTETDIPDSLVVPMLDPREISGNKDDFLRGLPICIFNQFYQATIQDITIFPNLADDALGWFFATPSTNTLRSKLYRPMVTGDSGSPVFLMKGTDEFVYFNHATLSVQDEFPVTGWMAGPDYTQPRTNGSGYFLDNIIDACVLLNSRYAAAFGGDPTLLPTYVSV